METSWQENSTNKDQMIATRPGFETKCRLPDGKAGGLLSCTDSKGKFCLLAQVDDSIYILREPFDKYEKLEI